MTPEPVRVLIVDDHAVVRRGLTTLLEEAGGIVVCGQAGDATSGLQAALATQPDVVVADLRLRLGPSGIDFIRELVAAIPGSRVLVLTSFGDDQSVLAAVAAGAAGYLMKDAQTEDLVASVRRVAAGEYLLDPQVTRSVIERLRSFPEAPPDPRVAALSPQQLVVLEALAEGLTNKAIAARLGIAEKTAKNHVSAVLAKLEVGTRSEASAYLSRHRRGAAAHGAA